MRPKYETTKDLQNEQEVADIVADLGYNLRKLPVQYRLDFAIFRDSECLGFAEVKTRSFHMNKYPPVMISLSKVLAADALTRKTGLPCYLICKYTDCVARLDFAHPLDLRMGGRTDRNDPQDVDICAFYPISGFTIVSQNR